MFKFLALFSACPSSPLDTETIPTNTVDDSLYFSTYRSAQALLIGSQIIQRSTEGWLFLWDAEHLLLKRPFWSDCHATSLGEGENGEVWVGCQDGRIQQLNLRSGNRQEIGKLVGSIIAVGSIGEHGYAVAVGTWAGVTLPIETLEFPSGQHRNLSLQLGEELGAFVRTSYIPQSATPNAVLANSVGLWMGWDWGEWGGLTVFLDWITNSIQIVKPETKNVSKIVTIDDNAYALGGLSHMDMLQSRIMRLNQAKSEIVYDNDNLPSHNHTGIGPVVPINQLFTIPGSADHIALAYHEVWRVSADFRQWTKECDLNIQQQGGPYAVDSYAPIVSAWMDRNGRLIVATPNEGLKSLSCR